MYYGWVVGMHTNAGQETGRASPAYCYRSSEDIVAGTYKLVIKVWKLRVYTKKGSICDFQDVHCPRKAGELQFTDNLVVPAKIPKGKYTIVLSAQDSSKNLMFCFMADIRVSKDSDREKEKTQCRNESVAESLKKQLRAVSRED